MKTISLKAYRYLKNLVAQQDYNKNGKDVLEVDIELKREAANILENMGKEVRIALTSTEYDKLTQEERRLLPNPVVMNTLEDIQSQNAISETNDISNILPSTQLVITLSEYEAIEKGLNEGSAKQRIAGHNKLARAHVKITQEELEDLNKQIDQIQQIDKIDKIDQNEKAKKAKRARNILNRSILVLTLTEMKEPKLKLKSALVDKLNIMIIVDDEKNKGIVTTNRIWNNASMAPITVRQEAKNVEASSTREKNKEGEKMVNGN